MSSKINQNIEVRFCALSSLDEKKPALKNLALAQGMREKAFEKLYTQLQVAFVANLGHLNDAKRHYLLQLNNIEQLLEAVKFFASLFERLSQLGIVRDTRLYHQLTSYPSPHEIEDKINLYCFYLRQKLTASAFK